MSETERLKACDEWKVDPDDKPYQRMRDHAAEMERQRDDLQDRLDGIGVHSCSAHCTRPACMARRERDEARRLAEEARDLLEREGYAVNALPWESSENDEMTRPHPKPKDHE